MQNIININSYLNKFKVLTDKLNRKILKKKQIEFKTGIWLDSVVLKLWKKSWTIKSEGDKISEASIFFSVWIEEKRIKRNQIFYNIHALKLRQLPDYLIKSREFAESFRTRFKYFQNNWPNVSMNYGPQTLMQGWIEVDLNKFDNHIFKLVNQFVEIHSIIDNLLDERKR